MIYYYIRRLTNVFDEEPTYAGKIVMIHNILHLAEEDDEVTPLEMKHLYKIVESLHAICKAQEEN